MPMQKNIDARPQADGAAGQRTALQCRFGVDPMRVKGYDLVKFTHMIVAAAAMSNAADIPRR
jgi:hypothetical protein